jgi:hypothetical protein
MIKKLNKLLYLVFCDYSYEVMRWTFKLNQLIIEIQRKRDSQSDFG